MTQKNLLKWHTVAMVALLVISGVAHATDPIYQKDGLAIKGFDPVAYFTQAKPIRGSAEFSLTYQGAIWQFSSQDHKDLFEANPEKYAPQYGGYCAYAVSKGSTAKIEPEAWKIVDGKLYLNYSTGIQKKWEKDIPGYIEKADANWPKVLEN